MNNVYTTMSVVLGIILVAILLESIRVVMRGVRRKLFLGQASIKVDVLPSSVGKERRRHQKVNIKWEIPFITYLSQNQFPPWMRLLRTYDIPLRKGFIKLPFSHLFYVIAEK